MILNNNRTGIAWGTLLDLAKMESVCFIKVRTVANSFAVPGDVPVFGLHCLLLKIEYPQMVESLRSKIRRTSEIVTCLNVRTCPKSETVLASGACSRQ